MNANASAGKPNAFPGKPDDASAGKPDPAPDRSLRVRRALLPQGWAENVRLSWDARGYLTRVESGLDFGRDPSGEETPSPVLEGPLLPGMPNLHSHAFQRAMAGLTESVHVDGDSFYGWRSLMYRFAGRASPEALQAIATALYVEMLEAGYTHVCEFHYVHHDRDGRSYAEPAELSLRLLQAARAAGIGITLLPVLYQASGFGGQQPLPGQARFLHETEAMLRLLERLAPHCERAGARLGLAPHSLRAVPPESLREAVAGLRARDATAPIHIHVAEQRSEVEGCLAWSGLRPLAWLLEHAPLDQHWCLVHATHTQADERQRAAARGVVAGLCPSTEANLGDGLFAFSDWLGLGGTWGIGSDSHVCVDAPEELRLLEYGQRLIEHRRHVAGDPTRPEVARNLWLSAVAGGSQASGLALGGLAAGERADFVLLDPGHPAMAGLSADQQLASHVFASHGRRAIAQVWCQGKAVVGRDGHPLARQAQAGLVAARQALLT